MIVLQLRLLSTIHDLVATDGGGANGRMGGREEDEGDRPPPRRPATQRLLSVIIK